jgi:hypothetical protein
MATQAGKDRNLIAVIGDEVS